MREPRPGYSKYLRGGYIAPTERVRLETRPSRWFYFFYPTLLLVLSLTLAYASAAGIWAQLPRIPWLTTEIGRIPLLAGLPDWFHVLLYVGVLLSVVSAFWLVFERVLRWPVWTYVVTDDRIIQQYGLIRHDFQEIPLRQIRDVEIRQDRFWDRVLGFGTIHFHSLSTPASGAPLAYDLIRDPRLYPSPRDGFTERQKGRLRRILRLDPSEDPRHLIVNHPELKDLAGAEWWGGVPNPLVIQREVELALRRGYGADTSAPGEHVGSSNRRS